MKRAPPADGQRGLVGRVAWHARLAWRSSWVAVVTFFALGLLARFLFPVDDTWIAAAVAGVIALLAFGLIVLGEARGAPRPTALVTDPAAALEAVGGADLVAHALARAAMMLAAFGLGVSLGGLLGFHRA